MFQPENIYIDAYKIAFKSSNLAVNNQKWSRLTNFMMTSSNGNIFRVTDPLCGELSGHRWIPLTKASHAELSCFLWPAPE